MISTDYSKSATFFIYLYFIFVVVTGGIIGLSLVNSIFVDSMVSDNNDVIEQKIDNLDNKLNNIIEKIDNHEA
jgi:voltage-gated sodium channel